MNVAIWTLAARAISFLGIFVSQCSVLDICSAIIMKPYTR
jgi:hypothetical protein